MTEKHKIRVIFSSVTEGFLRAEMRHPSPHELVVWPVSAGLGLKGFPPAALAVAIVAAAGGSVL
jgi:hypothetical protein